MIPKECKRLAEVDFPIAEVSRHSAREKSIRHGHPSTLHLWWARRPLAACRAMLLALLLPDPCDKHCPEEFKDKARELLSQVQGQPGPKDEDLRKSLLKFIGDFANWDLSSDRTYLEVSRGLVKAAHPEETPLVVDPFSGGGSIPLEALRLGCEAFASDLNPVACLILKVMLEDIPRHGPELADELRCVGAEIKAAAEKELAEFYPSDPDGSRPIAYLWARTVKCEAPNCGAEIPLVRSFWLSKKEGRKRALRYKVVRPDGSVPCVEFEIFEPKTDKDVSQGTINRAKATCLCCNTVLSPDRVKAQLTELRGGADVIFDEHDKRIGGACLLAVVIHSPSEQGRRYRLPTLRDYVAVCQAQQVVANLPNTVLPDEPIHVDERGNFWICLYGPATYSDLFTIRQRLTLVTFAQALRDASAGTNSNIIEALALAVSRCSDYWSSLASWAGDFVRGTFGRQALPMVWDFCEVYPLTETSGGFSGALDWVVRVADGLSNVISHVGQVQLTDARDQVLPSASASIVFTDPPYYDAVAYAGLSDFFLVWLKRSLPQVAILKDPYDFSNRVSNKNREIIQDWTKLPDGRIKDKSFFEDNMAEAFKASANTIKEDGISCIVFAHKTTEGWEALLTGIIQGGWTITGSWPVVTERPGRLRSQESAALATSVHLVCRPRPADAPVGDWSDVLRELPDRVGDWMERLQNEGVRGADLVFACIGPALEIFSRYSKVETAEGREVKLAEYLEKVWETVGREALGQVLGTAEAKARNGAAGAVEEDARLTALFLWTLQSTNGESTGQGEDEPEEESDDEDEEESSSKSKAKGFNLAFDVVRRFAQPLGIHLPGWEGRIIETKKGVVRLLSVRERAKQLFGEEGAQAVADKIESNPEKSSQLTLFLESPEGAVPEIKSRGRQKKGIQVSEETLKEHKGATTLDRVHAAMLLQASGRANALRALLKAEVERSPDFLRLSNALSALYPKGSEEKRLLDAMLLAVPR